MRQFAGFGTPEETNERYKELLAAGGTGLSVAFDLPTLMGRDPDHELSLGEVGKCGVSITSLADMERSSTASRSRHHDVDDDQLAGADDLRDVPRRRREAGGRLEEALGDDPERHPEGVHRPEGVHLPAAPVDAAHHRRLRVLREEVPKWNTISVSGYHIREAGSTALQELAFTLRDGIEYVQYGVDAGLDVDDFAPRISFFFNAHSDFFEEIAKYRAARKHLGRGDARPLRREATSARGSCASTRRRPACRSPRSSPTTTSSARRCRRWRRCSAAPTRCTPTRSTRRWRCRRSRGRDARAAHAADHRARERRRTNVVDPLGGSYFVER
jgi:methylmalonyl-CoA mutase, N-terminal domain